MKKLLIILNLLSGLVLVRFTVSKFAAWPVSVAGFVDMAKPLGIDPTLFRVSTGFIIGFAALSLFLNTLVLARPRSKRADRLLAANVIYVVGAMGGALISEFFLRSEVKWPLVYIAVGIIAVSVANVLALGVVGRSASTAVAR